VKGLGEFNRDKYSKDGRHTLCRLCQKRSKFNSLAKITAYALALKSDKEEDMIAWEEKYYPKIDYSVKECTGCHEIKVKEEFYSGRRTPSGLSARCKKCIKRDSDAYVLLPLDPAPDIKKCNECAIDQPINNFAKDRSKKDGFINICKSCQKNKFLKKEYGITTDDYDLMLINQEGKCAICKTPEDECSVSYRTGKPLSLAVDHCHETGRVRGLLCDLCNRGLGMLEHDISILESAIRYLKKAGI
jgi:hypothetical protein